MAKPKRKRVPKKVQYCLVDQMGWVAAAFSNVKTAKESMWDGDRVYKYVREGIVK